MLKHAWYRLFAARHRTHALGELRALERKLLSPASRFAVPFAFRGRGAFRRIEPRQNPMEIEALYRTILALAPGAVLEIGTARGGTLYLWTQAARDDAVIVSVDLPGGEFGGAYPLCRLPFYERFARPRQSLHLLLEDSHRPETLDRVRACVGARVGGALDFAFIDGDHTYDGVRQDFFMYGPLVRAGGLIAFHDILERPAFPDIEVHRFWSEIKDRYPSRELIGDEGTGTKVGIGLIEVPEGGVGAAPGA